MRTSQLIVMVLVFSIALLIRGASSFRTDRPIDNPTNSTVAVAVPAECLTLQDDPMGRGCCSWHGGECGCQNGRDVCCDGTLRPSCTCHKLGQL